MSIDKTDKNEISATEKLLTVIRKKDSGGTAQFEDFSQPGFFEKIKRRWFTPGTGDVIGVEILRDRMNLVRAVKGKTGMEVVYAVSEPMPAELNIQHPGFPGFLKQELEKSGASPQKTDIWAALPASKGDIWGLQVPRIRKGLGNAVYWSAQKEKAFDASHTVFDYRLTGEILHNDTRKRAVDFCTAPAADVALYKKVFSGIGYPLTGITLPAFALNNLFYNRIVAPPGQKTYAVLCIGEESSSINIYGKENKILFSRVIRTGRDSFVNSLITAHDQQYTAETIPFQEDPDVGDEGNDAGDNGRPESNNGQTPPPHEASLSRQAAERALNAFAGQSAKPDALFSSEQIFAIIEPALERIARQLERTIHHAVNNLKNPPPGRIYICGSVPFLPQIADYFSTQLYIPAELLDVLNPESTPIVNTPFFKDLEDRLSLVPAAGLAMPSAETVNFLHTAFDRDREKLAMRSTNVVAVGCAVLFVLTAGYWWYSLHEQAQARMTLSDAKQQLSTYSPRLDMDMITQMAGEHRETQKELADYSRKLHVVGVINEIQRVTPDHIRMQEITVDVGRPGDDAQGERNPALILEGFIRDDAVRFESQMAGYIRQLRRSPLVRTVEIRRGTRESLAAGETVYRFIVNIDLEQV